MTRNDLRFSRAFKDTCLPWLEDEHHLKHLLLPETFSYCGERGCGDLAKSGNKTLRLRERVLSGGNCCHKNLVKNNTIGSLFYCHVDSYNLRLQ